MTICHLSVEEIQGKGVFLGKGNWPYDDSTLLYVGAKATAEYLTKIFGQRFYPEVTPD